jgi:hypothetical protein
MQITEYVIAPEQLAQRLVAYVDGAGIDREGDKKWTGTVMAGLSEILRDAGIEMLYTNPEKQVSEFMLDLVAWNRDGLEGIILAAESEWSGVRRNSTSYAEEVAADFWKLLCVKSPLKLMVFASDAEHYPPEPILAKLQEAFELYCHHIPGEQYVFIDFAPGDARKAFYVKVPATDGIRVPFNPIPIDLNPE